MSAGVIAAHYVAGGGDPNSFLSGNRFWVSAATITPQADNSQLTTTWQDQSGLGNHLTFAAGSGGAKPLYRTTQSANGGPAVAFQSGNADAVGGYASIPASVFTGLTSGSAWAITKASQGRTTLWDLGPAGAGSGHFPFDDVIYENAFVTARGTFVGTFLGGLDQWNNYITTKAAAGGDLSAYKNNVLLNTVAKTFGLPASTGKLGGGPAYNYAGLVAAAGLIDHEMTSPERAALLAWGATL